ncbi:MAG: TMEM175 family protein [Lactobacillus sp.]|jgi:uncharacterized membrane protein|nr:TMEM175 family protein [Lactobacillus sp.]
MSKQRIEAFTDAVIAIIITIMVLELKPPHMPTFASLWAERGSIGVYIFSFFVLSVYWNNHHHLFALVHKVTGSVLWLNMVLMFFLSLFPFTSTWVIEGHINEVAPELTYGIVILLANVTWAILVRRLIKVNGDDSLIGKSLGSDYHKPLISIGVAAFAVIVGIFQPLAVFAIDGLMFLLWVIPERRAERTVWTSEKNSKPKE